MISTAEELSKNISTLCRICSAPGSHSIFAKIPPYLHEHPRECPRWTMPICKLITEVTGVDITEDDGLPQRICVLCISYLKHACTFRRQTIDNIAALLAAKYLIGVQAQQNGTKDTGSQIDVIPAIIIPQVPRPEMTDVSYRMLNQGGGRLVGCQKNLDKEVLQQVLNGRMLPKKKQNNAEEEQRQIEEAGRVRFQTTPPNVVPSGVSGFFSYTEKEFEEDDVMELDVLKENNIMFNLPEDYKEKKCPSCRKRFMFDDTHNEHLKECLQFQLAKFIREVYHLLFLKENRSISPFEFIRRVVFSIRKNVQLISSYDGDEPEIEPEAEETPSVQTSEEPVKIDRSFLRNLEKLRVNYSQDGTKIPSPGPLPQMDDGRSSITTGSTSISPIVTVTRCEECQATFETLTELETHNLNYHRELPVSVVPALNNLQVFSPCLPQPHIPPSPKDVEMIKNRLLSDTPESTGGKSTDEEERAKTVRCQNCSKRFYMISQLDEHRVRCRRKSPGQQHGPNLGGSSFDRNRKNLNASYFYTMERLKDVK